MLGNYWVAAQLAASQEGLTSMSERVNLRPLRWRQYTPLKRQWVYTRLYGVTSRKVVVLFIVWFYRIIINRTEWTIWFNCSWWMKNEWLQVQTSLNFFVMLSLKSLSFDFSTVRLNMFHSMHIIRTGRDSYVMVCTLACCNYPGMDRRVFVYGEISVEYNLCPAG
jgi:hypothetical protein